MSTSDANRNLLFGILALQMDFVGRQQLLAATKVWLLDKSKSIEEILVEQGALSDADRQLLAPLIERHIQNHDGDAENSLAALSSIGSVGDDLKSLGDAQIEATLSIVSSDRRDWHDTEKLDQTAQAHTFGTANADDPRFRVLRPHAKGGLGEVSVAEDSELSREVALKVIQSRWADDASCRSRFVLEAEVTGGLEHPGIVPVYGLGQYSDGRPFYAMRFIRGDSLEEAADRFHETEHPTESDRSLERRKLLGRFVDVCNAIAYAHSRGVLHRDLKPGNIMLGKYGETLVVDWGLAKLKGRDDETGVEGEATLQPRSGGGSVPTQMGSTVGTPAFMPPEQAAGRLDELGPASDVYSLGATLYYMLTGRRPIEGATISEVLENVRIGRIAPPRSVKQDVPKPLESVCLRAMANRPQDRYVSPQTLADDIERFLADEPVTAHPEPLIVRTRRWMRKHPKSVAALAATLMVGLTSSIVIATIVSSKNQELAVANTGLDTANSQLKQKNIELKRANQAERQATTEAETRREESEAVLKFFEDKVLAAARPEDRDGGLGINATIRAAVDAAEPQIADSFAEQPLVEASIRNTLGITYLYLGEPGLAISQHERARQLRLPKLGSDHYDTLVSVTNLATAYNAEGQFDQAISMYEDTLTRMMASLGPGHPDTMTVLNNLAAAFESAGRLDEALQTYVQALKSMKEVLGPAHSHTIRVQNNVGSAYFSTGQLDEAQRAFEESAKLSEQHLGANHPHTFVVMSNLAAVYKATGRLSEALSIFEKTLKFRQETLGLDHPLTLLSMAQLAGAYKDAGRLDEALPIFEMVLVRRKEKLGPDHPDTLKAMDGVASVYDSVGRAKEALQLHEEASGLLKKKLGPDHRDTLVSMNNVASAYFLAGRLDEALQIYEKVLSIRKKKHKPDHPDTLLSMSNLALVYQAVGRLDEALPIFEEVVSLRDKIFAADHPDTLQSISNLAYAYKLVGRLDEAIPMLEETLRLMTKKLGPEHNDTLTLKNNLALCYADADRLDQAIPIFEEAYELRKAKLGAEHPETITLMHNVAAARMAAGHFEQALPMLKESLRLMKQQHGPDHPHTLALMHNLATAYDNTGRPDEALPIYEETFKLSKKKLGPEHPNTLLSMRDLALSYLQTGKPDVALPLFEQFIAAHRKRAEENDLQFAGLLAKVASKNVQYQQYSAAESYLRECLAIREKSQPDHWLVFDTRSSLGDTLLGQAKEMLATDKEAAFKKFAEAEQLLVAGYEGMKKLEDAIPPAARDRLTQALNQLVNLYTAWDKPDEAARWQKLLDETNSNQ